MMFTQAYASSVCSPTRVSLMSGMNAARDRVTNWTLERDKPVDRKSFVPMLVQTGTTAKGRDLIWNFPNNWGPTGPGIGATSTIRNGDWKLIYFYEDSHFELYNISSDIDELHNLAGQQHARVKEMAVKLGKYLRGVKAQRPSYKSTKKPVPWPDEAL